MHDDNVTGYDGLYKDIPGYEGLYAITRDGRIWSYAKGVYPSKWLNPLIDSLGYKRTALTKNKICKLFHVHRLVAITWIPNLQNKPQVNHLNGTKTDNRIENLEWATSRENCLHSHHVLGQKGSKKQKIAAAISGRLNARGVQQLSKDGSLIQEFRSSKDAAEAVGTCRTGITACLSGRRITAGGFKWKFQEGVTSVHYKNQRSSSRSR